MRLGRGKRAPESGLLHTSRPGICEVRCQSLRRTQLMQAHCRPWKTPLIGTWNMARATELNVSGVHNLGNVYSRAVPDRGRRPEVGAPSRLDERLTNIVPPTPWEVLSDSPGHNSRYHFPQAVTCSGVPETTAPTWVQSAILKSCT